MPRASLLDKGNLDLHDRKVDVAERGKFRLIEVIYNIERGFIGGNGGRTPRAATF